MGRRDVDARLALILASVISSLGGVVCSRRLASDSVWLAYLLLDCLSACLYPLAYGVGIVERDACTPRQGYSSAGVAGRGHYTGLYATMMPGSGKDFLNGPVTHGPLVILALQGDTPTATVHDNVDALIPCSPEHYHLVSQRPEEVGREVLELGAAHGADYLEAQGKLPGRRGGRPVPQVPGHRRNGNDAPYQKEPTEQPLETLGSSMLLLDTKPNSTTNASAPPLRIQSSSLLDPATTPV